MASDLDDTPGVRLLTTPEDFERGAHLVSETMLGSVEPSSVSHWAGFWEGQTSHGAVTVDGELAGVARWFPTELSMAGPSLPAAGVTAVAVRATHRRQGHLRRLMHAQLESIAAAEVPIALLVAAEWPIYGRFGYGPAVEACGYEIDATAARFTAPPRGSVELVSATELRPHLEAVHDRRWARTIGAVTRDPVLWDRLSGVVPWPHDPPDDGKGRGAIWRDASGEVQGAVRYRVAETWVRNRPFGRIEVKLLLGATPEAERELWRHLCETDWISTVAAEGRGVDDPLPFWLDDARAATQIDRFDCIWARVLDVPRVLRARRAPTAGSVVIGVVDELGHASGQWSVELGPDGAEVHATTASIDVRLPVAALGALSLGGTSAVRLHHAGWMDEESPGGIARLDALLRSTPAPWSPTTY